MSGPTALVVLGGPTAVGKTAVAIELCQVFKAEVVSADSVQIYRGLDIGSAKPTEEEKERAPHHLIDVADPREDFDAARYVRLADEAIAGIQARGKKALVVGGTGLYLRALLHGLVPAPPADPRLRAELRQAWEEQGAQALHARLAAADPAAAARIHPADCQRVLRALEVSLKTGQPFSHRQAAHGFRQKRYEYLLMGLNRPRDELYKRIELRCHKMWEQGLIDEVQRLLAQGVPPSARSLQTLGYRHALGFIEGRFGREEALALMIRDTKAYAKRQITWFRSMPGLAWFSPQEVAAMTGQVQNIWA